MSNTLPIWSGQTLASPLAFDTETDARVDLRREVPTLVLAAACDGAQAVLLRPCQLSEFVESHRGHDWVGHNLASFDFWVVLSDLEREHRARADAGCGVALAATGYAQEYWRALPPSGRFHDTMLMDLLVRIALGKCETGAGEAKVFRRGLDVVCQELGCEVVPDKEDPFRLRYHELLAQDWATADPGFFSYALSDVWGTWQAWQKLQAQALELTQKLPPGTCFADPVGKYGLLTERIQVLGAIALAAAGRHGMQIDQARLAELDGQTAEEVRQSVMDLVNGWPQLLEWYSKKGKFAGLYKVQKKSGLPKLLGKQLLVELEKEAVRIGAPVPRSKGKEKRVSSRAEDWIPCRPYSDLLKAWLPLVDVGKYRGYLAQVKEAGSSVHPSYNSLVSTGRASCTAPNLQQWPKDGPFRGLCVAREGCVYYIADYAAIELRTFAAICLARQGRSKLAEVFNYPPPRNDPHAYTAAAFAGVPFEEFLSWKLDPARAEEYKAKRQGAKPVAFGCIGGLGGARLVEYARNPPYNTVLTLEQATQFRQRLITEIYPEMEVYLRDEAPAALAWNLGLPETTVRQIAQDSSRAPDIFFATVGKVLSGNAVKRDGEAYNRQWVIKVWLTLCQMVQASPLELLEHRVVLQNRRTGHEPRELFLGWPAVVPTGRARGACRYTAAKNCPFQGLAADGAKLALWELTRRGFKVAAFVHDEVVLELPVDRAESLAEEARQVMVGEMERVLEGLVPVEVEGRLSARWSKG